jgi:hypothetical protein
MSLPAKEDVALVARRKRHGYCWVNVFLERLELEKLISKRFWLIGAMFRENK